jgi:c(7)-type cytochrome triheme protein
MPPGEAAEEAAQVQPVTGSAQGIPQLSPEFFIQPEDTVTPPIELTLDPDSVVSLLPRDHAGNIDWMEALRQEIIRPRDGVDGPREWDDGGFEFAFDFYFRGPTEMFDAFFPHSAHTELMECAQCHPRIFKSQGTQISMADVLAGRYCGECHGKVAFPPVTGCERCHTDLAQPANRAQPVLLGTVQMRRATEILAAGDSTATVEGNATGVRTDGFARAQFPHWVHRIRYRCTTCHMSIFEPKAGTNSVTMVDIEQGRFCGECHNGEIAFLPEMTNCIRCHVPVAPASVTPLEDAG